MEQVQGDQIKASKVESGQSRVPNQIINQRPDYQLDYNTGAVCSVITLVDRPSMVTILLGPDLYPGVSIYQTRQSSRSVYAT